MSNILRAIRHTHQWVAYDELSDEAYSALFPVALGFARFKGMVPGRMRLERCSCGQRRSQYVPAGADDWAFLEALQ
jgi:hypothetical protein